MSSQGPIRVAGVQFDPKLGAVTQNRATMSHYLQVAAQAGARLVVFPECALTGYGFESKEAAFPFAETIDGPSTRSIAEDCARLNVHAVFGLLERDGDRIFNACALVGSGGLVACYRKIHLPYLGVDRFMAPGDGPFAVEEVDGLRIGMHICYDGSFPESGRVLSLLGADLLVLPTNWPTHSECAAEHMIATRAMENNVYAMAVNRVGEESGFRFIGSSSIVDPAGRKIATAGPDEPEVLYADVDPARARQKRLVRVPGLHEIDRMADRRPGFYGVIVRPNEGG
ncbi:MAG: carbon-nitrogen hydrolase family protein [Isosphaeraceae bacterium]|nr:carbon-nitrogen hydrolase family protein [Isosphaeraceae bacterium]